MTTSGFRSSREVEEAIERVFGPMRGRPGAGLPEREAVAQRDWAPRVDVLEDDDAYSIRLDVPGVKREDMKVGVKDDVVTVEGVRVPDESDETRQARRRERAFGTFQRAFVLPEDADEAKLKAALKSGVLTLTIPKTKKTKPRAIEVEIL